MIGLKTGTVKLVMHQDKWDNEAKRTIKELKDLLGNTAIDIQHIGSTAIASIHAKPIIDIAIGVYSLIDKLVSSVSALIATGAIALIGYKETMPQPTDELTAGIFWMTMALMYGFPIIGWIITLIAMHFCSLSKKDMVEVQKRIAEKKAAAQSKD